MPFLENVPGLSEALWNKPVDCVLLGVSGAWWFISPLYSRDSFSLGEHPVSLRLQSLRSRKELEYSRTFRTLDTNAANPAAINHYQFVRLLPARVVSVIIQLCRNMQLEFYSLYYKGVFMAHPWEARPG